MYSVIALQLANSFNIRQCKQKLALPILFSDSDELFLSNGVEKFVYVFQYGVVSFFNHSVQEINEVVKQLSPTAYAWQEQELSETMRVFIEPGA